MHHYLGPGWRGEPPSTGDETITLSVSAASSGAAVANGGKASKLKEIMADCDIVVATTGAPGLITPEMVHKGQIILALSNPRPEIEPDVAKKAGVETVALVTEPPDKPAKKLR